MTETQNVSIPPTLLRLGMDDVEDLLLIGLANGGIIRDDIQELMDVRYPTRRRAARSIVRLVSDRDIRQFNSNIVKLLDLGIDDRTRMSIQSSFSREMITLRIF